MTLTQTHLFCIRKSLLSNYFNLSNYLISHIAQRLLIRKFYCSVKVIIFTLTMRDIIIYVARWSEKYLSNRNPLKHTCSWRDKLIVLWTLNRQAKISFRITISSWSSFVAAVSGMSSFWLYLDKFCGGAKPSAENLVFLFLSNIALPAHFFQNLNGVFCCQLPIHKMKLTNPRF